MTLTVFGVWGHADLDSSMRPIEDCLNDLKSAVEPGEDFWFVVAVEPKPTEAMKAVYEWLVENESWYEIVCPKEAQPGRLSTSAFAKGAQEIHEASNVAAKVRTRLRQSSKKEPAALLCLYAGEDDNDELGKFLSEGLPVRELTNGLIPITFEEEEASPSPEADAFEADMARLDELSAAADAGDADAATRLAQLVDIINAGIGTNYNPDTIDTWGEVGTWLAEHELSAAEAAPQEPEEGTEDDDEAGDELSRLAALAAAEDPEAGILLYDRAAALGIDGTTLSWEEMADEVRKVEAGHAQPPTPLTEEELRGYKLPALKALARSEGKTVTDDMDADAVIALMLGLDGGLVQWEAVGISADDGEEEAVERITAEAEARGLDLNEYLEETWQTVGRLLDAPVADGADRVTPPAVQKVLDATPEEEPEEDTSVPDYEDDEEAPEEPEEAAEDDDVEDGELMPMQGTSEILAIEEFAVPIVQAIEAELEELLELLR